MQLFFKGDYEYVFVDDFVPVDRIVRFTLGIPAKCVLFTKSHRYILIFPQPVTLENALSENQSVVSNITAQLPSFHTHAMRRECMSCIGRISPTTKPYVLCEIYRQLTSELV